MLRLTDPEFDRRVEATLEAAEMTEGADAFDALLLIVWLAYSEELR